MKKILDVLKDRKGFSLLEVLMVMFVIGVIVAIISPDIASTGHKARLRADAASAACIGRALELYVAESNIVKKADAFDEDKLKDVLVGGGYLTGISAPKSGGDWSAEYTDKKVTVKAGGIELYPKIEKTEVTEDEPSN